MLRVTIALPAGRSYRECLHAAYECVVPHTLTGQLAYADGKNVTDASFYCSDKPVTDVSLMTHSGITNLVHELKQLGRDHDFELVVEPTLFFTALNHRDDLAFSPYDLGVDSGAASSASTRTSPIQERGGGLYWACRQMNLTGSFLVR